MPLVIVVAYRADEHLDACLATLAAGREVCVVDNGRAVSTRAITDRHDAMYLKSSSNLGFAGAVNLALQTAWDGRSDVLLLNPDARASGSDVAELGRALAGNQRLAAVGPSLVGLDGTPQRGSWPLPSPRQVWLDALGMRRATDRLPYFLVGACLLLSGRALAALGPLDERYFLYAEEADWQQHALREGWQLSLVDGVQVAHEGAASSSGTMTQRSIRFHASGEAFARKWHGDRGWQVMRLGSLAAGLRRSVVGSAPARRDGRATVMLYVRGPERVAAESTLAGDA